MARISTLLTLLGSDTAGVLASVCRQSHPVCGPNFVTEGMFAGGGAPGGERLDR